MRLEQDVRTALITARRAGPRRSLARVRRWQSQSWLGPRFAARLYPLRVRPAAEIPGGVIGVPISARGRHDWDGCVSLLHAPPFPVRSPVNWQLNPLGHLLWAYELHQFEWAWPLLNRAEAGDAEAADALSNLLRDYWQRVPFGCGVGWEPYPLSRRLVVWSAAADVLRPRGSSGLNAELHAQIDRAARLLAANIERDLDNNHVIANAKALAFAATSCAGGDGLPSYGRAGFNLMWEQLRAQVQSDGGHIEGTTSYHFLVWRDAVETALLARDNQIAIPEDIPELLGRMQSWLLTLRRPDGTWPLLGDSVSDMFGPFDTLAAATGALGGERREAPDVGSAVLSDSGYVVLRAGDTWLLFDAGPFGAAHCPGHGHADALSFELWAQGRLLIADPGVFQYQAGSARDYFRGTAAHSTLTVDGRDQAELSGSFRVGRCPQVRLTDAQTARFPLYVRGEQDGYRRLSQGVVHRRAIALEYSRRLVVQDEILGEGEHEFDLRFHFAPGCELAIEQELARARFSSNLELRLCFTAPASAERLTEPGWYSSTWYQKQPAPVLRLHWRGAAPCRINTIITIAAGDS